MKASGVLRQYRIVGRHLVNDRNPNPPLYRMTIFAPDAIIAKSRFWYFLARLKKIKKANGEIVEIKEVQESNAALRVKNYGVWLRYNSRTGSHNMYREYRDISTNNAITACYRDMGARHRARADSIQIIKVEEIPANQCRRPHMKQFHDSKLKFPLPNRVSRNFHKSRFTTRVPRARLL
ncbi:ribosomal protein L18A [Dermatophagoides pteronyssinus]|uniref:60S ribosomal protein L18A n=2 Tax=Dermatophagoides pteronyssinus TaxID=6956 RepID=A0ABQ8JR21_DERPT|nr:60S ribosomal protein L18a-like [Dermatophagoides pteronyssinus]KAH9425053.1 60S ribosomal protein L18A [Dermatophagoides pteronyssinus]